MHADLSLERNFPAWTRLYFGSINEIPNYQVHDALQRSNEAERVRNPDSTDLPCIDGACGLRRQVSGFGNAGLAQRRPEDENFFSSSHGLCLAYYKHDVFIGCK